MLRKMTCGAFFALALVLSGCSSMTGGGPTRMTKNLDNGVVICSGGRGSDRYNHRRCRPANKGELFLFSGANAWQRY